jgi:glycosyltransferase involved in cell wall biosynthesis
MGKSEQVAVGPLVSVVVNNYNYGEYLDDAIQSVLRQTYQNVEVIVVDDGSTDNSRDVVARYGDAIVPVLTPNRGQASAYNAGFAFARGELICLLDSDDVFAPTKVKRVVDAFERFPEAGWLRHRLEITDERLRPLGVRIPHYRGSRLDRVKRGMWLEHKARFVNSSAIAMRRATAASVLPIPKSRVPEWKMGADGYLGVLCAATSACYSLDEPLTYYRRRDAQRLTGRAGVTAYLDRSVRRDQRFSQMGMGVGPQRLASDYYKHQLVLASLKGVPRWSQERRTTLGSGLKAVGPLAVAYPWLAARQVAALCVAFLVPDVWIKRFMRMVAIS